MHCKSVSDFSLSFGPTRFKIGVLIALNLYFFFLFFLFPLILNFTTAGEGRGRAENVLYCHGITLKEWRIKREEIFGN